MLLLVNNLHEKRIVESQYGRNFGTARAICDLYSCYMKNALVVCQSNACYFSMYVATSLIAIFVISSSLPLSFQRYFYLIFALFALESINKQMA